MINWENIENTNCTLYKATINGSAVIFRKTGLPDKFTELRDGSYAVDFNGYKISQMFAKYQGKEFDFISELPAIEDENGVGYILFDEEHKFTRLILTDNEGNTKEYKATFVE